MMQVFDYIVIAYITLRTFSEINLKKTFIQGQVIGSRVVTWSLPYSKEKCFKLKIFKTILFQITIYKKQNL